MRVELECKYCGSQFAEYVYKAEEAETLKCRACGDRNLKKRKVEKKDAFGYGEVRQEDAYLDGQGD